MTYACLLLPFPPSVNNLFVNNPQTRGRFPSRQYKEWQKEAHRALAHQQEQPSIPGPVELVLSLGRPDSRKRDISNYIKAVEDLCVKAGLIEDDSLITEIRARWDNEVVGCRVEIGTARAMHLITRLSKTEAARRVS